MPDNFDSLRHLRVTLARWKSPSSWDRVIQDEPLDQPKGEWVPTGGANITTTGTFTLPNVQITGTNGGTYVMIQTSPSAEEIRIARLLADRHGYEVLAIVNGTRAPGQNLEPETAYGQGNLLPSGELLPGRLPYPRNHKERRIWKAIRKRLPELIRRAERLHGRRADARLQDEWNDSFWAMVTHDHVDERRKRTK